MNMKSCYIPNPEKKYIIFNEILFLVANQLSMFCTLRNIRWKLFYEKVVLKNFKKFTGKTCLGVSFLTKLQASDKLQVASYTTHFLIYCMVFSRICILYEKSFKLVIFDSYKGFLSFIFTGPKSASVLFCNHITLFCLSKNFHIKIPLH